MARLVVELAGVLAPNPFWLRADTLEHVLLGLAAGWGGVVWRDPDARDVARVKRRFPDRALVPSVSRSAGLRAACGGLELAGADAIELDDPPDRRTIDAARGACRLPLFLKLSLDRLELAATAAADALTLEPGTLRIGLAARLPVAVTGDLPGWDPALELLGRGASVVQAGPDRLEVAQDLLDGLACYLDERGLPGLDAFRRAARTRPLAPSTMA